MTYRVIASALSDHPNPEEWPTDKVLATPDLEDKGISVYEFDTLEQARAFAVEHTTEWLVANLEALVENLADEPSSYWHEEVEKALATLPIEARRIAQIPVGGVETNISCRGDWVRLEQIA